jgi:hypothetical protein
MIKDYSAQAGPQRFLIAVQGMGLVLLIALLVPVFSGGKGLLF